MEVAAQFFENACGGSAYLVAGLEAQEELISIDSVLEQTPMLLLSLPDCILLKITQAD